MPDIDVYEDSTLTLRAEIASGKSPTKKVKFIVKTTGGEPLTPSEKELPLPDFGPAEWEVKVPKVNVDEEHYELAYGVEAGAESYMSSTLYKVWPRTVELSAKGEDGKPVKGVPFKVEYPALEKLEMTPVDGPVARRGVARTTDKGTFVYRHVHKGPFTVSVVSPWMVTDEPAFAKQKGRKREAKVKRKPFKAAFVFPIGADAGAGKPRVHKQYVNLAKAAGKPERGSKLTVSIGGDPRDGVAKGDKVFVKVEFGATNSKRNDPKPEVDKAGTKLAPAGGVVTFDLVFAADGGTAVFDLECGKAGADTYTIKIGVTDKCEDASVVVQTWRRLEYEHLQPAKSGAGKCTDYTILAPGAAGLGWTAGMTSYAKSVLDPLGIEFSQKRAVFYGKSDMPGAGAHNVFDAKSIQKTAGKLFNVMTVAQADALLKAKGVHGGDTRVVSTIWMDLVCFLAKWDQSFDQIEADIDRTPKVVVLPKVVQADATNSYQAALGTGLAHGAFPVKKLGWKVTHYHDGTWKVPTDAAHPGYGKRATTWITDATEIAKHVEIKDHRHVRLKIPASASADHPGKLLDAAGKLVDKGKKLRLSYTVVGLGLNINMNGAALRGQIWMNTFAGNIHDHGVTGVILHELGHNMGQAYVSNVAGAAPTFGRPPAKAIPGVPIPAAVPGGKKYEGKGHQGNHCADGLSATDRAKAAYTAGAVFATHKCIMFGASDMKSATKYDFCDECKTAIKAEDLSDIRKKWT